MPRKSADRVRAFLRAHPNATNTQLYRRFNRRSKSSLRAIARTIPEVREARGLPPLPGGIIGGGETPDVTEIAYPITFTEGSRYGRQQLTVARRFKYTKIQIPLNQTVIFAMREVFEAGESSGFGYELVSPHLVVQVAREGKVVGEKVEPVWEREFITIPTPLTKIDLPTAWKVYEDSTLARVDNYERGAALIQAGLVALSKSDPVFMRPVELRLYLHGPETTS